MIALGLLFPRTRREDVKDKQLWQVKENWTWVNEKLTWSSKDKAWPTSRGNPSMTIPLASGIFMIFCLISVIVVSWGRVTSTCLICLPSLKASCRSDIKENKTKLLHHEKQTAWLLSKRASSRYAVTIVNTNKPIMTCSWLSAATNRKASAASVVQWGRFDSGSVGEDKDAGKKTL